MFNDTANIRGLLYLSLLFYYTKKKPKQKIEHHEFFISILN